MRLSHNMPSLNIFTGYSKAVEGQKIAMGRISTGIKVSSSKDNAAALDKSERINMQIRGLQMANRNLQDGASIVMRHVELQQPRQVKLQQNLIRKYA